MSCLRIGFGERTITPPLGVDLCGYGFYLGRRAESVIDDLKVRAVFLESGGRALLLASCDVIGFTVEKADAIRAGIAAAHGLPRESVLLAATHTHCGPATQPLPGLGDVDPAYLKRLEALVAEAAAEAAASPRPAEFSYALEAVEPVVAAVDLDGYGDGVAHVRRGDSLPHRLERVGRRLQQLAALLPDLCCLVLV